MTQNELFMYDILGRISSTDAPIVFKGGLITKLILAEKQFTSIDRATVDIDANWIGTAPSMEQLVQTIKKALGELNQQYEVQAIRDYGEKRSAGLAICDKNSGMKILSMDIDIAPSLSWKTYYFGEIGIRGILVNEILADKIAVVSSDLVYKYRAKDLIDVYALSSCATIDTQEIFDACQAHHRTIQNFDGFINQKAAVEHAYNKLRRIENKPSFLILYQHLENFLKPFIAPDNVRKTWIPEKLTWQENTSRQNIRKRNRGLEI